MRELCVAERDHFAVAPAHTSRVEAPDAAQTYRFVPISTRPSAEQARLDGDRIGAITMRDGTRLVVVPDGSIERAAPVGESLMGGVPIPARLGGGYLFWTDSALYRAHTFLATLEPVAPIPTNVVGVEFGHDTFLLYTPESPPRALALDPPRAAPQSPHGVTEIAGADDERTIALDATGRALASIDGGKTWKDVTTELGDPVRGLHTEAHEVAFVRRDKSGAWLQKDGTMVVRPIPTPNDSPEMQRARTLFSAVTGGLPLPDGRALVGDHSAIVVVDLRSGAASAPKPTGPEGSSCQPLTLEDEGVVACASYSVQKNSVTIVSHALGASPRTEKSFAGHPDLEWGPDALIVSASCSGALSAGVACVRGASGAWRELDVRPALGPAWRVRSWVPKEGHGAAAVAEGRDERGRAMNVALIDPDAGSIIRWDVSMDALGLSGARQQDGASLRVLRDGSVRGFTETGAFAVDSKGHVTIDSRKFASLASAAGNALARDESRRLWQTTDAGRRWVEVAPPPYDYPPHLGEPSTPAGESMICAPTGCVLEHGSEAGSWLRLGWPEAPPVPRSSPGERLAAGGPASAATPLAQPAPLPASKLPAFRCTTQGKAKSISQRLLARRAGHENDDIPVRDLFSATERYILHGLRAVMHVRAPSRSAPAGEAKTPFEAAFVAPLDPLGSIVHVTGSMPPLAPSMRNEPYARPVLSREPGRADGVLVGNDDIALWVPPNGKARPLILPCVGDSGCVDQRGELFVACPDAHGQTEIRDVQAQRVVLRVPAAGHFRLERDPGMRWFPPGGPESARENPDVIAVAPDGKLGVLRLPSGRDPATVDDPAWFLSPPAAPVELSPWSSIELASSPACARSGGYRALVQTARPWMTVEGADRFRLEPGMTALVRWSPERICLEAIELPMRQIPDAPDPAGSTQSIDVMLVARFVGPGAGAAMVGTGTALAIREPATCELAPSP